jgi:2-iminobutanoate/2-iminopropanoate deaminase
VLIHYVDAAPQAIGPYCHAIQIGELIFCSGQTPINPETNELEGSSVAEQTERALQNLELVLKDVGVSLQKVIKTTVFLTSMDHFSEMNEAYARCFGEHTPARTTVAVRSLPLGALVEIECIAEIGAIQP